MSQTPSYPMYNFETRRAELTNRFEQENAAADYARFLEEQGFKRQGEEAARTYSQMFPRMTGAAAGRLGSEVQSGVFRNQLGRAIGDYQRGLQDLDIASAQAASQFQTQQGLRRSAYERALQALDAELAQYQAGLSNAGIGAGGGVGGGGGVSGEPGGSNTGGGGSQAEMVPSLAEFLGYTPLAQSDPRFAELTTPIAQSAADPLNWREIDRLRRLAEAEQRQFDVNDPYNWRNIARLNEFNSMYGGA